METDFLNFHDEEHFGTALYQNELLEDSQSSLLDIVGDEYQRQNSDEYGDHSIIWEQDVERELNGDVAVIPMSGQINSFPKLSNSPPSKDFQRIFSDWQHLTAIEATPTEDLAVDLHLPSQVLVGDMLDCFTPSTVTPTITIASKPTVSSPKHNSPSPNSIVSSFDFSNTTVPKLQQEEPKIKKKEVKPPVRKIGGKNLELLKQVIKQETDLNTSFKSDLNSSDELDSANDNFDITSYVNGFDDDLLLHHDEEDEFETKVSSIVPVKQEIKQYRKYGGCYEKNMPNDETDIKPEIKQEEIEDKKKILQEDSEEDCIDVETVSEQIPVLEARDLNSLLEQFEASEAVNPKLPQNVFEEKSQVCQLTTTKLTTEPTKPTSTENKNKTITNEIKQKIKQLNAELKQPTNKQQKTTVSIELLQKIKASTTRKPVSVIPARPSKKIRGLKPQNGDRIIQNNKIIKMSPTRNESFHLDHDYCSVSPARNLQPQNIPNDNTTTNHLKKNSPDKTKCDNIKCDSEYKKNIGSLIDDTAIRISLQIKNAIINENALKQKQSILRKQATVKNSDGKLMISLLKTNNRNSLLNKFNGNTIINTINTNDEQIQNIIVSESVERNSKKRKLNLEEYKKLRGDLKKNSSAESSGSNSPMPQTHKVEYQELIMKMAKEILKTNAKQKPSPPDSKLDEFIPPDEIKPAKIEIKREILDEPEVVQPKMAANYEMKTIVSIGVNTDETIFKNTENKITFKLNKRKEISRNKFFDSKSPESEDTSPKKEAKKLTEIITPILQNANCKINSNSLITNITATLLQQSPKLSPKPEVVKLEAPEVKTEPPEEHGEDKTVIILNKNDEKPQMRTIAIQTDFLENNESKEKAVRNYRTRRDSSASSSASNSSLKSKKGDRNVKKKLAQRQSLRNSSSNSISSSMGSRWSRSRSRSRSRSSSHSEYSSYSSDSSRSKSRSISPRRWHTDRSSRSRHRYNRSRRRSSSNNSYRGIYRHSRSPYSRSRSRRRREKESADRERMREVEERRVIYVGKINDDTTRADLRRRFQNFGPITNVSVHFREHGDNYGFVTFAYKMDAYEAVERGNDDPNVPKYDISFGGRRAFCKTRYSDLDNIEQEQINPAPIFRREEDSFDILLREVQAKLRKRKV